MCLVSTVNSFITYQSEADIEAVGAKPIISTTVHSRSQLKQYDTEVVTRETIKDILTELGLSPESQLTRMVVNNSNKDQSILSSLFEGLLSAGFVVINSIKSPLIFFFRFNSGSRSAIKIRTHPRDNDKHRCKI